MTRTLTNLLRALHQNILSILRDLPPPRRDELLAGLTTLLERCRRAAPDELTDLHREFTALFTRAGVTLPEPRVTRSGGLESFSVTDAYRESFSVTDAYRGQLTLLERVDSVDRILRGAFPVKPAPVTLHPDARAPQQVQVGHVFSIEAQICATAAASQPESLQAIPGPDGRVHVRVALIPGEGLEMRSPADADITAAAGQDSHVVAFRVVATRPGPLHPKVCFLAGTATATTPLELLASDAPLTACARSATTLALGTSPSGLHLTMLRRPGAGDDLVLHLRLHRDGALLGETTAILSAAYLADLHDQLTKLGEKLEDIAKQSWARTLRAFGRGLADDLLRNLRDPLQAARAAGTPLFVQSTEAELPLELCLLEIDGREVFLGEHFAVSRADIGPSPAATFHPRPAILVWDPRSGFDLTDEESSLRLIAGAVERSDHYDDVLRRLEGDAQIGVLHFAVHGNSEPGKPRSALVKLEGGTLDARILPRTRPGRPTRLDGGLVFLNACRTGAAQSGLVREGSLIDAFRRAGVAAIVAPAWSVDTTVAGQFASHVYRAVADGKPLDEAVRHARTRLPDEPDRLAYVLHAAPGCRPEATSP